MAVKDKPVKSKFDSKKKIKTKTKFAPLPQKGSASPTPKPRISEKNRRAIALLDSWDNPTLEEIAEQKETWAFLKKALDEDRLSPNRPHFPEDNQVS